MGLASVRLISVDWTFLIMYVVTSQVEQSLCRSRYATVLSSRKLCIYQCSIGDVLGCVCFGNTETQRKCLCRLSKSAISKVAPKLPIFFFCLLHCGFFQCHVLAVSTKSTNLLKESWTCLRSIKHASKVIKHISS